MIHVDLVGCVPQGCSRLSMVFVYQWSGRLCGYMGGIMYIGAITARHVGFRCVSNAMRILGPFEGILCACAFQEESKFFSLCLRFGLKHFLYDSLDQIL